jgi:hypothetical protein
MRVGSLRVSVAQVVNWRNGNLTSCALEKVIDEIDFFFYYLLNTGKEVIEKYMSSKHSEVAET